jgi:hypothetical protein
MAIHIDPITIREVDLNWELWLAEK